MKKLQSWQKKHSNPEGILELIREKKLLTEDQIKKLLDPAAMTGQKQ